MGCSGSKSADAASGGAMNKLALTDVDVKGKRVLMRSVPHASSRSALRCWCSGQWLVRWGLG